MNKLTVFSLVLVMAALAGSERLRSVKRLPKRQIFDTIDFNTGYKSPKQNLIPGAGKKTAADYLPPTGNTYLPPISSSKSTPAPKYLIPTTRLYTTQKTTYRTLGTIPPYTGTFPTYRTSTYNYTYTGTYPTPPTTFRPLVTTATTKKIVIGYEYTTPKADFANEEIGLDIKRKY